MTEEQLDRAVDNIFEDLRDRRFLKWLFTPDVGRDEHLIAYFSDGDPLYAFDREVQQEIRDGFKKAIRAAMTQ